MFFSAAKKIEVLQYWARFFQNANQEGDTYTYLIESSDGFKLKIPKLHLDEAQFLRALNALLDATPQTGESSFFVWPHPSEKGWLRLSRDVSLLDLTDHGWFNYIFIALSHTVLLQNNKAIAMKFCQLFPENIVQRFKVLLPAAAWEDITSKEGRKVIRMSEDTRLELLAHWAKRLKDPNGRHSINFNNLHHQSGDHQHFNHAYDGLTHAGVAFLTRLNNLLGQIVEHPHQHQSREYVTHFGEESGSEVKYELDRNKLRHVHDEYSWAGPIAETISLTIKETHFHEILKECYDKFPERLSYLLQSFAQTNLRFKQDFVASPTARTMTHAVDQGYQKPLPLPGPLLLPIDTHERSFMAETALPCLGVAAALVAVCGLFKCCKRGMSDKTKRRLLPESVLGERPKLP